MEKYNDEKYIGIIRATEEKAHEPIRPTNIYLKQIKSSSHKEVKIYNLIWEISLQSCMSESIYDSMDLTISAPTKELFYTKNSKKMLFEGWEIVKDKKTNKEYDYLFCLKEGIISYKKINSISSMIDGETYYTESSLIKKIEHYNFGRPSTYSSLVEKIKERKYVLLKDIVIEEDKIIYEMEENIISKKINKVEKVEKNKLIIQPLGIKVIEFIYSSFSTLFDYEYTSQMEHQLDDIVEKEKGSNLIKDICDQVSQQLQKEKKEENSNSNIIRIINKETSIRKSKHGEYIYHKKGSQKKPIFISLENFDEDYLSCSEERILEWIKLK